MVTATEIQSYCDKLADPVKDIKLNLKSVLDSQHLSPEQALGTALAVAINEGNKELITIFQQELSDQEAIRQTRIVPLL